MKQRIVAFPSQALAGSLASSIHFRQSRSRQGAVGQRDTTYQRRTLVTMPGWWMQEPIGQTPHCCARRGIKSRGYFGLVRQERRLAAIIGVCTNERLGREGKVMAWAFDANVRGPRRRGQAQIEQKGPCSRCTSGKAAAFLEFLRYL